MVKLPAISPTVGLQPTATLTEPVLPPLADVGRLGRAVDLQVELAAVAVAGGTALVTVTCGLRLLVIVQVAVGRR